MATFANGKVITGRLYYFKNKAYPTKALNVWSSDKYPIRPLSNVCLWDFDKTDRAQIWRVVSESSSTVTLRPVNADNSTYCLDRYTGTGTGARTNAHIYPYSETSVLKIIPGTRSDSVKIMANNFSGYFLAAYNGENGQRGGKTNDSTGNVFFASGVEGNLKQEWIPVEITQKLIHPFEKQYYTVGYKDEAPAYPVRYSYGPHYAVDMYAVGDATVKAMGNGEILGTKTFTSLGNVLAVKYNSVLNRDHKDIGSIVVRYCHLAKYIKTSGPVSKGEEIAIEGATGKGAKNAEGKDVVHLHMEFDTDTDYPLMTPTEGGGVDSTINPLDVLYKSEDQTVIPDCDPPANSSEFYNGLAWYNADKIRNTPLE